MTRRFSITILASLLLAGVLGAWQWLGDASGGARPVLGSQLELATPTFTPKPPGWQTPRPLPITPTSVSYVRTNPAFEPLPGARAVYGQYQGGTYQIEVPDDWNGDVVYFAHGLRENWPELTVTAPPLRQHFIDLGFAWAASSYNRNGYEPGAGARDTLALQPVFERRVGIPRFSYINGESMGGNVVALSLEQYPTAYDGGLSECGALSATEELGYFVSWAALAQYLSGVHFIDPLTPQQLTAVLRAQVIPALGTPPAFTDAGHAFVDAMMRLSGGPRPFFAEGFAKYYFANFYIISHALQIGGNSSAAGSNQGIRYTLDTGLSVDADQLNREIERFAPVPPYTSAVKFPEFQPMTGAIERPLLTLHDTGDLLAPISIEQSYAKSVRAAGRDDLLVQRAVRRAGHCNFSRAERERAFDDLVTWVEQGRRPEGEDLSGDLTNAGLRFTTPLEPNDPSIVAPSIASGQP